MNEPGCRMNGESNKAFSAFTKYRDMGPERSLRKLAKSTTEVNQFKRWSKKFSWVRRCEEWDDHLDHEKRNSEIKRAKQMARKHCKLAMELIEIGKEALDSIDPKKTSASDVCRLLTVGMDLERKARATVMTERTKAEDDKDFIKELKSILYSLHS